MKVDYFTPFHKKDTAFLERCYKSLLAQTVDEWGWVLVRNGEGIDADLSFLESDNRVKIFTHSSVGNIGALKKFAVSKCTAELVAELDWDDRVTENCTQKLLQVFSDGSCDFAYSSCYECKNDVTFMPYGKYFGWQYAVEPDGKIVTLAKEPSPASFSFIYYFGNHIRVWKRSFYENIGGHDQKLEVCDDYDLGCRSYINGNVKMISEPLYYYYHHSGNTSGQTASDNRNAKIQELTQEIHDKYIQLLCLKWCQLNNYKALDLGARFNPAAGFTSVDLQDAQIIMDLQKPWDQIPDNSVGCIRAAHLLEHLSDTIHFFNEAFRVLVPGGFILLQVPSTSGSGAFSDPTHVKFFNLRSFRYFYDESLARFIQPQYKGKFQCNRVVESFWPAPNQDVAVIDCHMICLKPPYANNHIGEMLWDKKQFYGLVNPVRDEKGNIIGGPVYGEDGKIIGHADPCGPQGTPGIANPADVVLK